MEDLVTPTDIETGAEASTSSENQNLHKDLENEIQKKLSSLGPPLCYHYQQHSIYRVPERLRKVNSLAYTPQVVSIGPLHCHNKILKKMEAEKFQVLKHFLARDGVKVGFKELVCYIKEKETRIRICYAEKIDYLDSDSFVKMVLLDATFILELFLNPCVNVGYDVFVQKFDIDKDLILLENQLPFFILKELYEIYYSQENAEHFTDLTIRYFKQYNKQKKPFPENVEHFTDLLRYFQLPTVPSSQLGQTSEAKASGQTRRPSDANDLPGKSFLETVKSYTYLLRYFRLPNTTPSCCLKHPPAAENVPQPQEGKHLYSVTELHESGVKFKLSEEKCLLAVEFTNDGILKMPSFELYDETESLFRNLMALEQCHYLGEAKICDYIGFVDFLINTKKDVEFLVQKKIIVNWLGDHQAVADLVNKFSVGILECGKNGYNDQIMKLNKYYEVPHHKWKATLIHEYFRSPWRSASTIAAFTLLVLTLLQTVFSGIGK